MLDAKTLGELNKAFDKQSSGFVVLDQGQPRFVVLAYEAYRKLKGQEQPSAVALGKILVTGGAGYIGSIASRLLQKMGYEIVVLDNLSTGKRERVRDCELIVADLADRAALDKVFRERKFDAVVHFAASIESEESVGDPVKYFQNNVLAGLNLLDMMINYNVKKLVFSSSAAVYGEPKRVPISEDEVGVPTTPYGESKLMFERILKWYGQAYGLHSISLRYFNAAGAWPEQELGQDHTKSNTPHIIPKVLNVALGQAPEFVVNGQDYQTADGTCVRDYVHVLDLAEAHAAALEKLSSSNGAYAYNVGTGLGHSVLEIIDAAMELTGRMVPMRVGPRRAGDPTRLVADISKIRKDFGWSAKRGLAEILESSWTWQKQNK